MAQRRRSAKGSYSSAVESVVATRDVTLDQLLGALPEDSDLAAVREALLRASHVDMPRLWASSNQYATYDKRVISADDVPAIIAEAAHNATARITALYNSLGEALSQLARGDRATAAEQLIAIGELAESHEQLHAALQYYRAAERLAENLPNPRVRTLAMRRQARVLSSQGDIEESYARYRASCDQAAAIGDLEGHIAAHTGLGNALGFQGRWLDASKHYETALALCGDDFPRLRGQLHMNFAAMLLERGELAQAANRLTEASQLWQELAASDQTGWYNTRGLLALERDEIEAAQGFFNQALATSSSDFDRAMVLDNLAELFIRQENLADAEAAARSAEQHAVRAGSPRALAEIYTRLGKIFRLRGDSNGVTFFEKALEICRGRRYPLSEANAYLEYGIFRRMLGDQEEANSYFERSCELFTELGAEPLRVLALAELTPS